ncbi:hypothetical protein [Cryobacterium sp. Hh7]|nr:hypothetical protein [Cryobacterium sp. Hh7]
MTYEISSPTIAAEHPEQHDTNATGADFRRRQLDIFRQRECELELEESR